MVTGYKTRKKRLRGTTSPAPAGAPSPKGEGIGRQRRVEDVWYTPTIKDVYAQLKVAEQMLSRCPDPALAIVRRKMYDLEDTMWQFISE